MDLRFAAALALLVAGCTAPAPMVTTSVPLPPVPHPPVTVIDATGGQGEPSLGVAPDGTLFTDGLGQPFPRGQGGVQDVGSVYRSTTNGTNWTRLDPGFQTPDLDPDLAVSADGTVWADNLYVGCTSVAVSRDHGATWTSTPAGCNVPGDDRQYLVPTVPGTAYLFSHQLPSYYQTASKSTDYGQTWVPIGPMETPDHQLLVNSGSGWSGGGFWNAKTGSVFGTWSLFGGGTTGPSTFLPAFAVTRDGTTWTDGTATTTPTGDGLGLSLVVGAADLAGNVYLAWGSIHGQDVGIFVAGSHDDGRSWTPPVRIDVGNGSKVFPAIAAGSDGHVAVAYYQANRPGYPASVPKDTLWNVTLVSTPDFFHGAWSRSQLSASPVRKGAICPDGSGCNSDRQFLDYFALKRLPDGRVGAVWCSTEAVQGKLVNQYGSSATPILK
ncbi:MAG: hypothetical protein ACYDBQ_08250 [Thermoplasmatota archaeon]